MSAGNRWHERETVNGEDPGVPQAILLWMRGQENAEQSVLPWEAETGDAVRPEAPDEGSESEEILAYLLRAIENTEVAARLQTVALPDKGHAPASVLRELLEPGADSSELAQENSEAFAHLMRAIQSAEIAETQQSIPREEFAEPAVSACTPPAEFAETAAALAQEPRAEASARLGAAPPPAQESGESSAATPPDIHNAGASLHFEGITPPGDGDSAEPAISEPVESAAVSSTLPTAVPGSRPAASGRQNRRVRRGSRRRRSDWQRADYLLSIAAPAAAPPHCAAQKEPESTEAAERYAPPRPAEPLPVVAATTVVEPEAVAEASIPPAEAADATAKPPLPVRTRLGTGSGTLAATGGLINEGLDRAEMHLENWFQKWFGPPDPRKTTRVDNPPLVAYHWIVDVPQALKISNISSGGLQLITKDRWSEGNIVSMTLQRTDKQKGSPESWIAVDFLVMRWCEDGMAGAFIPSAPGLAHTVAGRAGNCADKKTLERFVARLAKAGADRKDREMKQAPRQTIAAAYSGGASPAGM